MSEFYGRKSHEFYQENLIGYLYGEMPADAIAQFEDHLRGCSECQGDLQEFRDVRQALGQWQLDEYPHISVGLSPSLAQSFRQLVRVMPLWLRAASFAAAALLLLALVNLRVTFGGPSAFEIRAGLRPPTAASPASDSSSGISEQKVDAMIQAAVRQEQDRHRVEISALFTELAGQLKSERQNDLTQFAETIRREQHRQIQSVRYEMDHRSRPTFASLFLDSDSGASN